MESPNNLADMKPTEISNYQELAMQIERIRELKDVRDQELKENFKDFIHAVSPIQMAKSALHEFVKDKDVQFDLVKGGLNLGADFIIENVVNRKNNLQGFLSRVILENVSSSFIQKNAPQIIIGMTKFISVISDHIGGTKEDAEEETEPNQPSN